ncbi:MAG: GIY-YIG nuclease family protein [Alkalibacterium sp.]|uniref:GIY-YIG nuclease family protein n=1 Tax=Alkalibacterium sp. TaxID=1872447 RepID=UPI0039705591
MIYTVYILYSVTLDRYYVGFTSNLEDRLKRHNEGKNKHTKSGIPWKLMYQESFDTRSEAMAREKKIKSSESREELLWYIRSRTNELGVQ